MRLHSIRRASIQPPAFLLALLVAVLGSMPATAQLVEVGDGGPGPVKAPHLTAEMTSLRPQIAAGGAVEAGLIMTLEEHWHVYWSNAGDSGEPPKITWTLPKGITADPMQFPPPQRLPLGPLMDFGYEGQAAFPILLHAAKDLKPGKIHLDAKVSWLVCAAQCLPGKAHMGLDLDVVSGPLADPPLVGALGAAIKSLPEPLPAEMHASAIADAKSIGITLRTGDKETGAQIYPFEQNQISNAAPEGVEPLKDGARVVLARDPSATAAPTSFHGLVELNGGQSYEFTAPVSAGAVAAAPEAGSKGGAVAPSTPDVTLLGELALAFGGGLLLNLMP